MSTPSGPYDQTPPPNQGAGEYGQNPPPYPGYQPYPGTAPNPYGQPAPGQPTYPQPYPPQPYGAPYPGYPVPPPPQKRSNKTLWIILGVVGGVLLLACVSCAGLAIWGFSQVANSPIFVATEFCADEQAQNYNSAYNLLSSNLQGQISQTQFVQDNQNADSASGTVSACDAVPADAADQSSGTSQSFTVEVTRGGSSPGSAGDTGSGGDTGIGGSSGGTGTSALGTTTTGTMTLIQENGSWKIDSIDQSLGLS